MGQLLYNTSTVLEKNQRIPTKSSLLWENNDRHHDVKCILEIQQCQILYSIADILYYTRMLLFPRIRGQFIANHLVYTLKHILVLSRMSCKTDCVYCEILEPQQLFPQC